MMSWICCDRVRAGATLLTWDLHFREIPMLGTIILEVSPRRLDVPGEIVDGPAETHPFLSCLRVLFEHGQGETDNDEYDAADPGHAEAGCSSAR